MQKNQQQLSEYEDNRIENLIQLSKNSSQNLKDKTIEFLSDPYAFRLENKVEETLKNLAIERHRFLAGAFKFYLFAIAAENEEFEKANELLSYPETSDFLFDIYNIPNEYQELPLKLHKVGTTSYVVRIVNAGLVMKIVKLRYIDNQTISQDTKNYKARFGGFLSEYSPKVHYTGDAFIIMDFIDGQTLHEYMESDIWKELNEDISKTISFFSDICTILKFYAQHNVFHLDLSPENILITKRAEEGKEQAKVHLIDFGYNYLLGEKVGTSVALLRAQVYMAPELLNNEWGRNEKNGKSSPKILADVYSLGVILLEMLSGYRLTAQEFLVALDRIRVRYPSLGQILEEMLDPNPESRIFEAARAHGIYDYIQKVVKDELQIYQEIYLKKDEGWVNVFLGAFDIMFPSMDVIRTRVRELKYIKKSNIDKAKKLQRLLGWSALTQIANVLIIFLFGAFLYDDIKSGNWQHNLPGRMVGLSFSLIATSFYTNIFSYLDARELSRRTEFWLRFNSFIFAFPILWAMIINPSDWPFCSALGVWFVASNNYHTYKLSITAKEKMLAQFPETPLPTTVEHFLNEFSGWWEVMTVYGICLLSVGILLKLNLIKDEWVYAIVVSIVINMKIYRYNATLNAPRIRAGLERFFSGLVRAFRFEKFKNKMVTHKIE